MSTPRTTQSNLLAAIDYSDVSELVVEHALSMAKQTGAHELHFLHVRPELRDPSDVEGQHTEFEEWLAARARNSGAGSMAAKIVCHEACGNPADVITTMASELVASAVVVGTHGRKGLERMVLGSVAEAVVRNAGCPVLVVRPVMYERRAQPIEPGSSSAVSARRAS